MASSPTAGAASMIGRRVGNLHGIFAVRKPAGESSSRTVERIKHAILSNVASGGHGDDSALRRRLKKTLKVGHGGTLDPMATGVLVIGLGSGCKQLQSQLRDTCKTYRAVARLGQHYDTYDRTGVLIEEAPWDHVSLAGIEKTIQDRFTGTIQQRPPAFSALHVNGKRAYEIARERQQTLLSLAANSAKRTKAADTGTEEDGCSASKPATAGCSAASPAMPSSGIPAELELPERPVTIYKNVVLGGELPKFELEVECSSGTYIRSLIYDIGRSVGTVACMWELERTRQGPYGLAEALSIPPDGQAFDLDQLEAALQKGQSSL